MRTEQFLHIRVLKNHLEKSITRSGYQQAQNDYKKTKLEMRFLEKKLEKTTSGLKRPEAASVFSYHAKCAAQMIAAKDRSAHALKEFQNKIKRHAERLGTLKKEYDEIKETSRVIKRREVERDHELMQEEVSETYLHLSRETQQDHFSSIRPLGSKRNEIVELRPITKDPTPHSISARLGVEQSSIIAHATQNAHEEIHITLEGEKEFLRVVQKSRSKIIHSIEKQGIVVAALSINPLW